MTISRRPTPGKRINQGIKLRGPIEALATAFIKSLKTAHRRRDSAVTHAAASLPMEALEDLNKLSATVHAHLDSISGHLSKDFEVVRKPLQALLVHQDPSLEETPERLDMAVQLVFARLSLDEIHSLLEHTEAIGLSLAEYEGTRLNTPGPSSRMARGFHKVQI